MIKGNLFAKADGEKIRIYFIQRGDASEAPNLPVKVYRRLADEINFSTGMCGDDPGHWTYGTESTVLRKSSGRC